MGSSMAYYPVGSNGLCVAQRPTQDLRYQRQPERDIYFPALRSLGVEVQGIVVVGNLVPWLGLGAQILRSPDSQLIAVLQQASEHLGSHRSPLERPHPSQ